MTPASLPPSAGQLLGSLHAATDDSHRLVLISSYLSQHLVELHNAATTRGLHVRSLAELSEQGTVTQYELLSDTVDFPNFLLVSAGWLKHLDRVCSNPLALDGRKFEGVDGIRYFVGNLPLVQAMPRSANQGSISSIQWRTCCIPEQQNGVRASIAPASSEVASVRRELTARWLRNSRLRVAAGCTDPHFPMKTNVFKRGDPNVEFLEISELDSSSSVGDFLEALRNLLRHAADSDVDLLVLPELYVPPTELVNVRAMLKRDSSPPVVVLGLGHSHPAGSAMGDPMVNEAVAVGWGGVEVLRHRKTVAFGAVATKPIARYQSEFLACGDQFTVMPLGPVNLAVAICVEFFAHDRASLLRRLNANIFAVPSKSPSCGPHVQEAVSQWAAHQAITVCANVWDLDPQHRRTFIRGDELSERTDPGLLLFDVRYE